MATWKLTLHQRTFTEAAWSSTIITELVGARSRRLEQNLNQSATLTFTMDGREPSCALINEMQHEVIAWRGPTAFFRGVVAQSEDEITEQGHTVNFTCHDYFAVLNRRWLTSQLDFLAGNNTPQNAVVDRLLDLAKRLATSSGVSLTPGSYLPLVTRHANPDGSTLSASQPPRARTYLPQQNIGEAIDDLAHVIGGFDYEIIPSWRFGNFGSVNYDWLRTFYPQQGVTRTDPILEYGGPVTTVTRSVNSADYANYWRVIGAAPPDTPDAPPMYSEAWNTDANDVGRIPIGVWMDTDQASDVSIQSTLDEKAQGNLNRSGVLVPAYTLGLRPDVWDDYKNRGLCNMGDTVPVVIKSGRLNVTSSIRIIGIAYDMTDDGTEQVSLTVGRPLTSLVDMLTASAADINALARR